MKSSWAKWIISILFPVASLAFLLVLGFTAEDVHQAWNALLNVRRGFVFAVAACWCGYISLRALALVIYCRCQGHHLSMIGALRVTLVGLFYAGITPAATGGQPMQVYELTKRSIPASVGTSAVAVETAGFQFLLVLLTTGMWVVHGRTAMSLLTLTRWVLTVGLLLNLVWTGFLVLVLAKGTWIAKPVEAILRFLGRIRVLRNPDRNVEGLRKYVGEYEQIAQQLFKRPALMIASAALSCGQVLCYMSMVYFVYRGFGWSTVSYGVIVTIQMLMYLCASMIPTPGASGAQEGSFYLFLGKIFPESSVFPAMLVWRFFTYYLTLLAGALTLLIGMLRTRRVKISVKPDPSPGSP
ncbi:hypothetical protein AGMMS49992_00740 [Clostridia bacterium]|nr:hypothetical protein AGMMS49992_00740 [Clostridia bacterium]